MGADLSSAAKESRLADRYAGDEALLSVYMRKLIKPGWPGQLDPVERAYRRLAKRKLGRYVPSPPARNRFRRENGAAQQRERAERPLPAGSRRPSSSGETPKVGAARSTARDPASRR